jgi:hypothetical protein
MPAVRGESAGINVTATGTPSRRTPAAVYGTTRRASDSVVDDREERLGILAIGGQGGRSSIGVEGPERGVLRGFRSSDEQGCLDGRLRQFPYLPPEPDVTYRWCAPGTTPAHGEKASGQRPEEFMTKRREPP